MGWLLYSLLTVALYMVHDVLLKQFAGSINPLLAGVVINTFAALGLLPLLYWKGNGRATGLAATGSTPLAFLALAGIALGLATVTFMKAFEQPAGNFSVVMPVVYVSIIILSVLTGFFVFKERITPTQIAGVALACTGLLLIIRK